MAQNKEEEERRTNRTRFLDFHDGNSASLLLTIECATSE